MGSSSKKQKNSKEKKRRHRSRSPVEESPPVTRERHRHRKHHKERRHERSRHYESDGSNHGHNSPIQIDESPPHSNDATVDASHESLSIDETNRLRAKLGLKPLEVKRSDSGSSSNIPDGRLKDDLGEFYHKPASNIAERALQEKLRAKIAEKKERRKQEAKLSNVITLGQSDSEDDLLSWVENTRKMEKEKRIAERRAKALDELDKELGVADMIESEKRMRKARLYNEKQLKGLTVEHGVESFEEGQTLVLTLKDNDVLAEDGDVLVNVNLLDDERYKKSNEFKKQKPGYTAYEEEFDEQGNPILKTMLSKYDEEIDGAKKQSFVIGQNTASSSQTKKSLAESIREKLSGKHLESLNLNPLKPASDFYSEEEMTKFKKPKKKIRKIREKGKMLTAAELAAQLSEPVVQKDHGSRHRKVVNEEIDPSSRRGEMTDWMDIDDVPDVKPGDFKIELDDSGLERSLRKARRLKQKEQLKTLPAITNLIKPEPEESNSSMLDTSGSIILNSTAEFCRTLGDIPTYGKSGNRELDEKDLMEYEKEEIKDEKDLEEDAPGSMNVWNSVEPGDESLGALVSDAPILDEEPDVGAGVGGALRLAMSKGYLDREQNNRPSSSRFAHLQAKHYSIEDKTYGGGGMDDDKMNQRRERYNGPTMDFKEKDSFRPNVKLEYIDDEGHLLNPKEAFRYLSHKFHGKGPGKNKIEKRLKKAEQEGLMNKMSSTDTPLGTLHMLQHKQREVQSPYIVLSGSKSLNATAISKVRR